ncbi:MAG: hypothetical protein JJE04_04200 [Acidobacteriia bacterium]|nr:hypothetical protein [Terriglobia bacterium]
MSIKFQITLPDPLAAEMKAEAARLGIPLAQWIRETMQQNLRSQSRKRNVDPFAWMDGMVQTPDRDWASRVDEVVYGDGDLH